MNLHITALYVSLTAMLMLFFAWNVVQLRKQCHIGLGCGDNPALEIAIRIHGNLVENAPIFLLLFACAELNGLGVLLLHAIGLLWLWGRILHGIGMRRGHGGRHHGRFWGVLITWSLILLLALFNLAVWFVGSLGGFVA